MRGDDVPMKKLKIYGPIFTLLIWVICPAAIAASSEAPNLTTVWAVSSGEVDLAWQDRSANETDYVVERSTIQNQWSNAVTFTLPPNTTQFRDTTVVPQTTYYYRIVAGGINLESNIRSVTTMAAPTGLAVNQTSSSQIKLTWQDSAPAFKNGYEIERTQTGGTTVTWTTNSSAREFTDGPNIVLGTTYTYRIRAFNNTGFSSYSDAVSLSTIAPAAPTNLTATGITGSGFTLSWVNNANNVTNFTIYRRHGTSPYSLVSTAGPTITSFPVTGLTQNTTYYFKISANNHNGSNESAEIMVQTLHGPPLAPTNLRVTGRTHNSISLAWANNADNADRLILERRTGSGSYGVLVEWTNVSRTTYTDSGLSENTQYTYRIRAVNSAGNSEWSEVTTRTLATIPGAPTNFRATNITSTEVTVEWSDNSHNETEFKIERRTGSTWGLYTTVNRVNETSHTISVSPSTSYTLRIRATNSAGDSVASNEITFTTPSGDTPNAPTNLSVLETGTTSVTLTWVDRSNNEDGFRIERKRGTESFRQVGTAGRNDTTYRDTGLTEGVTYVYRIRAYNNHGNSAYTAEVSATPGRAPAAPTNLVVTEVTSDSIRIAWTDQANNETGFKIERKTGTGSYSEIATVGANTTSYRNTGLSANTLYTYRVRAYNSSGNSAYTQEVSMIAANTPMAPTNLRITSASGTTVSLAWADNSPNETGFKIERRTATGSYAQIATVGANVTSFTNTGLTANTMYQYRVRAFNNAGDSPYSNEVVTVATRDSVSMTLTVGRTSYTVNQLQRTMVAAPIILEGRTLLPIRYVTEAIGAQVVWNAASQKVTVTLDDKTIELWIGRSTAVVNGVPTLIDSNNSGAAPIVVPPGRTMLPLRFIAEKLGCNVDWDGKKQQIRITYPANQ